LQYEKRIWKIVHGYSKINLYEIKKRRTNKMGAIIVSISVSVIAIIGSIFFYLEDKRKKTKNEYKR